LDGTIFNLESKVTNFGENEAFVNQMRQSTQTGAYNVDSTRKFNVSSKLFKLRYLCKSHLQLCAVLSQLNKHQDALLHGQIAAYYCEELIRNTSYLCDSYIERLMVEKESGKAGEVQEELGALTEAEPGLEDETLLG
jgi:hypothetical protein